MKTTTVAAMKARPIRPNQREALPGTSASLAISRRLWGRGFTSFGEKPARLIPDTPAYKNF